MQSNSLSISPSIRHQMDVEFERFRGKWVFAGSPAQRGNMGTEISENCVDRSWKIWRQFCRSSSFTYLEQSHRKCTRKFCNGRWRILSCDCSPWSGRRFNPCTNWSSRSYFKLSTLFRGEIRWKKEFIRCMAYLVYCSCSPWHRKSLVLNVLVVQKKWRSIPKTLYRQK